MIFRPQSSLVDGAFPDEGEITFEKKSPSLTVLMCGLLLGEQLRRQATRICPDWMVEQKSLRRKLAPYFLSLQSSRTPFAKENKSATITCAVQLPTTSLQTQRAISERAIILASSATLLPRFLAVSIPNSSFEMSSPWFQSVAPQCDVGVASWAITTC